MAPDSTPGPSRRTACPIRPGAKRYGRCGCTLETSSGSRSRHSFPTAHVVDQDNDPRLTQIAVALARTSTVHAAATHIAVEHDWDFLAVGYPLLAEIQRHFLRFRPPRLPPSRTPMRIYAHVVDVAYRVQDAMLGSLLSCLSRPATVLVVSPYGFASAADRPSRIIAEQVGAALAWHRPQGILAARGAGVARDRLVHGARVEDIAPTILALFDLQAENLDGESIEALFASPQATRPVRIHVHAPIPDDVEASLPVRRRRARRRAKACDRPRHARPSGRYRRGPSGRGSVCGCGTALPAGARRQPA